MKIHSKIVLTFLIIFSLTVLFFNIQTSLASISKQISYQGKLTDSSNVAKPDGNYNMIISLYTAASGGTPVWTARGTVGAPTARSVALSNGIFSIMLGDTGAGDNAITLDFNTPYYLGVQVGSDSEMTPRKPIGAAGYAFNSDLLDGLDTATVGANAHIATTDASGNLTVSGSTYFNGTTYYINNSGTANLNGLTLAGGINVTGSAKFGGAGTESFITPGSTPIPTKINIPLFDPGAFGQVFAAGLPSTALATSRVLSLFDARTVAHQPTLGIFSVNEADMVGFSWEGGSTTGYIKTLAGNIALRSNATDIMTLLSSGYVGIGTTSPGEKLSVNGNGLIGGVSAKTELYSAFSGQNNAFLEVGSGVSTSNNSYIGMLSLSTNQTGLSQNVGVINFANINNSTADKRTAIIASSNDGSANSGNLRFFTSNGGVIGERIHIDSSGNVGIGTTNPGTLLDINSASNSGAATSPSIMISGDANKERLEVRSSITPAFQGKSYGGTITSPTATPAGKSLLVLGGSGYDGTGWISGNPVAIGLNSEENFSTTTQGAYINFYTTTPGTTSKNERMRITGSGNVGIGTTNPQSLLHLQGNNNQAITIQSAGTSTSKGYIVFQKANGSVGSETALLSGDYLGQFAVVGATGSNTYDAARRAFEIDASENWTSLTGGYDLTFWTRPNAQGSLIAPTERMRILNNGNVGIGDTTPLALLTVGNGDLFQVNSSGQIAAIAGYTQGSGNFAISGTGTFGTGTGAISLNGATSVTGTNTFSVGTGLTTLGGNLTVTGTTWTATPTISGLITATSGLTSNGTLTVGANQNFVMSAGTGTFTQTYTGTATAKTITANSLTSGNILSLTSNSTAAAAGNTGLNIAISGANGTSAITRYGLQSAVTATNATSGTNIAGYFSASGATTANYGLIVANGYVGIGTTNPYTTLEVSSTGNNNAIGVGTLMITGNVNKERLEIRAGSLGQPTVQGKISGGTYVSPTATVSDQVMMSMGGSGYDGTQWTLANSALIGIKSAGTWSATSNPSYITFENTPIGGTTSARAERMRIDSTGYVGIGTISPQGILNTVSAGTSVSSYNYFDDYSAIASAGTNISMRKSNSDTNATNAATTDTTLLGVVTGKGNSGSVFTNGAYIGFYQQGAAGTYTPTQIRFGTSDGTNNWAQRMVIDSSGNVGIGTNAPSGTFDVHGAGTTTGITFKAANSSGVGKFTVLDNGNTNISNGYLSLGSSNTASPLTIDTSINTGAAYNPSLLITGDANMERIEIRSSQQATFQGKASGGTVASPTATPAGKVLASLGGAGYDGTSWGGGFNNGLISIVAEENYTPTNLGTYIAFATSPVGSGYARAERMRISSTGNVGIGTTGPLSKLSVAGAGNANYQVNINGQGATSSTYGLMVQDSGTNQNFWIRDDGAGYLRAAAWTYGSDRRMKQNITQYNDGLDIISKLTPSKFDYISGSKNQIGFIAQDVQQVLPEIVQTLPNGMLGIQTDSLIPVLVNAVNQQQGEIANTTDSLSGLNLKTDQNISTLSQLQSSVDDQFGVVQKTLAGFSAKFASIDDQANKNETRISNIETVAANLQKQMDALQQNSNQELLTAKVDLNKQDIDYLKLLLGLSNDNPNRVMLSGSFVASSVDAGVLKITNSDKDKKTIGSGTIFVVKNDVNGDGIDDDTKSDGKSVIIKTTAVDENSKIYVTPVGSTDNQVPYIGKIKAGESFEIKLDNPTTKDVQFNWWIVENTN